MSGSQVARQAGWSQGARPMGGQLSLLAVVLTGSFMAVLDTTIVNVALPAIAAGTGANPAGLE